MTDPNINLYIKPGCPWCSDVVSYLEKNGYGFREIDVIADSDAFSKMVELSGQGSAPTMTVAADGEGDDLLLADFGVDELVPFLDRHGIGPD